MSDQELLTPRLLMPGEHGPEIEILSSKPIDRGYGDLRIELTDDGFDEYAAELRIDVPDDPRCDVEGCDSEAVAELHRRWARVADGTARCEQCLKHDLRDGHEPGDGS